MDSEKKFKMNITKIKNPISHLLLIMCIQCVLIFNIFSCKTSHSDSKNDLILLYLLGQLISKNNCPSGSLALSGGSDPLFTDQWHLYNSTTSGEDANVSSVWSSGITGSGVVVSVVDDGLEILHEDLCNNVSSSVSGYNYATKRIDPTHSINANHHGSSVAGVIASISGNNLGGKGVAYDAKLVGRNILEGATDSNVAEALTSQTDLISISNNSWGAADGTGNYSSALATSLWKNAIISGITTGRNGKGTLYFWAAGNGGLSSSSGYNLDNSNFDGQANYYGVLSICGVGEDGKRASYSEKGANLWVCAHTQGTNTGFTRAITTTDATGNKGLNSSSSRSDLSNKNYTKKFNGTSSAAPLASGVTALLLSKYPNLSWRDAREILAKSARKNDSTNSDWTTNTAGYNINHNYGFGTIDASRVMSTASTWSSITNPLISCDIASVTSTTGQISFSTSACNNITKIEFIEINFSTTTSSTGTINIELFRSSTSGTKSILIESHLCASEGYPVDCQSGSNMGTIRMGTSRHLGESVGSTWILKSTPTSVTFTASLIFYGRIN